jgi:hypothetical protein
MPASSSIHMPQPKLKEKEKEIFSKEYHVEQKSKTLSANLMEEQRMLKTQRELETQKKYL